jgi:hypothetical protein
MTTSYRVIGFGNYQHGFFNQPHFRLSYTEAMCEYETFMCDPEFEGAVLIEVQHETWRVIEEFGTEGYSVEFGPVGNFKVSKSPDLVIV